MNAIGACDLFWSEDPLPTRSERVTRRPRAARSPIAPVVETSSAPAAPAFPMRRSTLLTDKGRVVAKHGN